MTPDAPTRDPLSRLTASLYQQLLVLALGMALVGLCLGGPAWGLAAGLGPIAAIVYYFLLAQQTRRVFAAGVVPPTPLVVFALAGRQVISLAVPAACFFWLGQPWLACLFTLVVPRPWILLPAWPRLGARA